MLPYLLALVAILIIVWLVLRKRKAMQAESETESDQNEDTQKTKSPWHAVSVRVGPDACLAAKTMEGRRFLAAEAPTLPLAECSDSEACQCRFIHHEDRRSGRDRRAPFAAGGTGTGTGIIEQERRQGGDRRKGDHDESAD